MSTSNKNMKKYLLLYLAFIICLFAFTRVQAQTKIAPEKKKLIAEIISVLEADKKVEEVMQSMFKQMDQAYPAIIHSTIEKRTDLTPGSKVALEKQLVKQNNNFSQRFQQKMLKAIDFQEFVEFAFYPLYDKFFTVEELKSLLEFYKTPTGQKLSEILPQLSAESVRLSQEYLIPKIGSIVDELVKEDIEKTTNKEPPPKRN